MSHSQIGDEKFGKDKKYVLFLLSTVREIQVLLKYQENERKIKTQKG